MYSEKVLNEFYNAQHFDVIKAASGVGKVTSDIGSEIIKIYIKVENEKITDAKFQTFGGVVAIAASSVSVNYILGKSVGEVKKFNANKLSELLGEVPETKMYILNLTAGAVLDAIDSYYERKEK